LGTNEIGPSEPTAGPPQWRYRRETCGRLDCHLLVPPSDLTPTEAWVLCHGFGAPGDDLVGLAEPLLERLVARDRVPVLVFPEGLLELSDYGMPGGRAWWPLSIARLMQLASSNDLSALREEVPDGIDEAREALAQTISLVLDRYLLSTSQLILGGFSQGAMLTVDTALRGLPAKPRCLIALSGALICEPIWSGFKEALRRVRVLQTHGRFDPILPIQTGRWLRDFFEAAETTLDYMEFDGPHTIPIDVLARMLDHTASSPS
jgi:phospholipase/carboxylesterase